jgi:hypothetical protein
MASEIQTLGGIQDIQSCASWNLGCKPIYRFPFMNRPS